MSVTLTELATFMKLPTGYDTALLQEHLDAATEYVTDKVGPLDEDALALAVHAGEHQAVLVLPATFAEEIVSVTSPTGADVPIATLVDIDLGAGLVEVRTPARGTWTVNIKSRGATASCSLATKIIAQHLWGTQRGTGGGRQEMRGQSPDTTGATPAGFAIPRRAAQLLEPYLTANGFA